MPVPSPVKCAAVADTTKWIDPILAAQVSILIPHLSPFPPSTDENVRWCGKQTTGPQTKMSSSHSPSYVSPKTETNLPCPSLLPLTKDPLYQSTSESINCTPSCYILYTTPTLTLVRIAVRPCLLARSIWLVVLPPPFIFKTIRRKVSSEPFSLVVDERSFVQIKTRINQVPGSMLHTGQHSPSYVSPFGHVFLPFP